MKWDYKQIGVNTVNRSRRVVSRGLINKTGVMISCFLLLQVAGAVADPDVAKRNGGVREIRNVLLYVVDDQGMEDAGCYGNNVIKTPGLDQLAADGVMFSHAFCTSASCSASRSVILTGIYNHANGQYGHAHEYHNFKTFPEIRPLSVRLKEIGYSTACVGKFHLAPESVYNFDQYMYSDDHLSAFSTEHSPEDMARECRTIIENKNKPFFIYFCTKEPHRPFLREGSDPVDPKDVLVPSYLPDIPECRDELAKYYQSVQRADKGLLELVRILKQEGQWDNTLIIYLSDNGIAFPGAKTTLYEPGTRLPLVVRNPFLAKKGMTNHALVNYADIVPTVLDFVGAQKSADLQGRSFLSVLGEENPVGWDETYASHTFHEVTMYYPMRAVRTKRYKLIWNIAYKLDYPFASDLQACSTWQGTLNRGLTFFGKRPIDAYLHRPEFELYDIQEDPDEIHNLSSDPSHAGVLEELKQKIKAFQISTKDPWVSKWEYE